MIVIVIDDAQCWEAKDAPVAVCRSRSDADAAMNLFTDWQTAAREVAMSFYDKWSDEARNTWDDWLKEHPAPLNRDGGYLINDIGNYCIYQVEVPTFTPKKKRKRS